MLFQTQMLASDTNEIIEFDGQFQNNGITLQWLQLEQHDNALYIIQSLEESDMSYYEIGRINSNERQSNSELIEFTHMSPALGNNYYRLIIKLDDDVIYTDPIMVAHEMKSGVKFCPNPVREGVMRL